MPIEAFWAVRDLIQEADYLVSTGQETSSVGDVYQKIYKLVAPHTVLEVDRAWLYGGGEADQ